MKIGWSLVAGLGTAGLLLGSPARANEEKAGSVGSTGAATESSEAKKSGDWKAGESTYGKPGHGGVAGDETAAKGAEAGSVGGTAATSGMGMNQVTGKVQDIDRKKNELSLRLKVSETTQVTKEGRRASLSDIQEGDQIRASFTGSGDSLRVTEIEIMPKGASGSTGSLETEKGSTGSMETEKGSTGSAGSATDLETPPGSKTDEKGSTGRGY